MQELFVVKIHFYKFLSMTDKPQLDQQKSVTANCSTSFSKSVNPYKEGKYQKKGEISCVKKKYEASPTYQVR